VEGRLLVRESEEVILAVEACNPNLGNVGFPDVGQTELEVLSTDAENKVAIAPRSIRLSKFGRTEIQVSFPRMGQRQGTLVLRPTCPKSRIAEVSIPYEIAIG
jgi:hypothetical protein